MNSIGITYYTENPNPNKEDKSVIKKDKCIGILEKIIQVSEIDENVINFIDVEYTSNATISINNISTKNQCDRIIKVLETIKKNLKE